MNEQENVFRAAPVPAGAGVTRSPIGATPPALQHFEPLWPAERMVLRAAAAGAIATLGYKRPDAGSDTTRVRGEFLGFLARGHGAGARVRGRRLQVVGAWIEGRLDLSFAHVPMSLWLYRCAFTAAPLFDGARVTGSLSFPGCWLPGLHAQTCRIDGELALNARCHVDGDLLLGRASLGRDLNCDQMHLGGGGQDIHRLASRFNADGAHIVGDVLLSGGFEAVGEVSFIAAHIGGDLLAAGAHMTAPLDASGARGAALNLDRLRVGGSVRLDAGFSAAGQVRLQQARIEGDLDCSRAAFDSIGDVSWGDNNAALHLDRARIGGALILRQLQDPLQGASLADARVGALLDDASTWGLHHVLDGFAYRRFAPGAPTDSPSRLGWLGHQTEAHLNAEFRPDPWQRLIGVLRRTGHDESAREVAIGLERHLRAAGRIGLGAPRALRGLARFGHDLFGLAAGYGHRPLRLLAAAAAVWLACAGVYGTAAQLGHLAPNAALVLADPRLAHCPPECPGLLATLPAFQPLVYSLDVLVPLVDLQQKRYWKPVRNAVRGAASPWGGALVALTWLEALCGWAIGLTLFASFSVLTERDRRR